MDKRGRVKWEVWFSEWLTNAKWMRSCLDDGCFCSGLRPQQVIVVRCLLWVRTKMIGFDAYKHLNVLICTREDVFGFFSSHFISAQFLFSSPCAVWPYACRCLSQVKGRRRWETLNSSPVCCYPEPPCRTWTVEKVLINLSRGSANFSPQETGDTLLPVLWLFFASFWLLTHLRPSTKRSKFMSSLTSL